MKKYQIVAVNLGSTSTKVAYFENDECVYKDNLKHAADELLAFPTIWDQQEYRTRAIEAWLNEHDINPADLDAVTTRGGHTKPIVGGTYRINDVMLEMSRSEQYGNHPTDLGLQIAVKLAAIGGALPLTTDPPTTDEFEPLARYSGLPELPRRSSFHALNHRAVAKQYAKDIGKNYADLNLIVCHMGGGITIAAHKKGKMIDANNGLSGDGPFSSSRTGSVPESALVDLCYSGQYTKQDILRKLKSEGGLMAYTGSNDLVEIEKRAADGDEVCSEALDAMCYQVAKEIASLGAVLYGEVDAILMTGGQANSQRVTEAITERVKFLAPVVKYPGEFEMQSLGGSAYEALSGLEPIKEVKWEES